MLSVIIPARNEEYLEKTIRNVLENADGEIEIIAVLDGYLPDPTINIGDDRVKFIHFQESIGQRQAINYAAKEAKGEFIMKLDAHCAVGKGFDVILARDCKYEWTMIPRMYNLDINTFTPKKHKRTDYMYISSPDAEKPFRAQYYEGRAKDEGRKQPDTDKEIDETMCCMGPCFFMHKERFWELGGCDEGHGGWGQQGIEVAMKAWLSGGALMVNKRTWFAHWFRGGGGPGFPYPASGKAHEFARKYSQDLWLNDKWDKATRKLQYVIDKFNPPGWKGIKIDVASIYREIRHTFGARVQNDFPPHAGPKGTRMDLLDMFNKLGYKKGIEIGVNRANYSTEIFKRIPNVHLTLLDPWAEYQYSHRSKEGQNRDYNVATEKVKPYIDKGQCTVVRDYSQNVHMNYEDESFDFVYIDGAHDFDHTCLDLIYWVPKVKKGGIVAVHDYYKFRRSGVVEAVNAYTKCHMINIWYTTKEVMPTAFWVKE